MRVEKESEKAGIKLSIPKANSMASSTITSWQIDGEKSRNSDRFYFLVLQIIFVCVWWLQPWIEKTLDPWKKSYDKLSVLKRRDITLPTKFCIMAQNSYWKAD